MSGIVKPTCSQYSPFISTEWQITHTLASFLSIYNSLHFRLQQEAQKTCVEKEDTINSFGIITNRTGQCCLTMVINNETYHTKVIKTSKRNIIQEAMQFKKQE